MEDQWWITNQLKIKSDPVFVKNYDNGYKLEKYLLTDAETKVPFDFGIDPGLHFR